MTHFYVFLIRFKAINVTYWLYSWVWKRFMWRMQCRLNICSSSGFIRHKTLYINGWKM